MCTGNLASVSNSIKTRELLRRLQDNYVLCKYCLLRQISINTEVNYASQITTPLVNKGECNICKRTYAGNRLNMLRISETLSNDYNFNTF